MWDSIAAYAQESGSQGSSMSTIYWIIGAVGLWKMFEKAGEPGWIGLIPFYRDYKLCEKVMANPWYWVRELVVVIPIIGWLAYFYFKYQIGLATARAYGKQDSWAWGYTFLDPIFFCITGFDSSVYYGPFGSGDRRTGEARGARTVDFDVIEEPVVNASPDIKVEPAVNSEPAESDVDFNFERDGGSE